MGITGSGINRFRGRVDAVLVDAFPVVLGIGGTTVTGSGPGGRTVTMSMEGGEAEDFRFPFRIPKGYLAAAPEVGDSVDWIIEDRTIFLEVCEAPLRPHESTWSITCRKRRVP